ncbi:MAG: tyrosine-type recombinase/integrase [Paracoccus sp. (in: a-proteobacteria)]|uniref:tyrosine-type recombinase/integrase n=1 Tax=Paracoccus sp. TaxID=267 RepID=UPI0040592D70
MSDMRLHDPAGNRLYLNAEERAAFLAAARRQPARDRTLCETLHFTGCRPSELIEITPARVDLSGGAIAIRSLKKRRDASGRAKLVYRTVPVPPDYLDTLNTAHGIREAQRSRKQAQAPIWPLSRVRVWQIVTRIMIEAGIPDAPQRSPKGLRHGFGINAAVNGIPLHMLQKWLGHAQLSTTAIYADATGKEEQDIAARMWAGSFR